MTINIIVIIEDYYDGHDDSPFWAVIAILLFWPILLALILLVCIVPILNVVELFKEFGRMRDDYDGFFQKLFGVFTIICLIGGIVFDCWYIIYGSITGNWGILWSIFDYAGQQIDQHYSVSSTKSKLLSLVLRK
jgi:hypothetical protein